MEAAIGHADALGIPRAAGDPKAAAQALLEIIDSENPSLRVFFGSDAPAMIRGIYQEGKQTWRDWEGVSRPAQGGPRAS
jgi:hypothetical protein